MILVVLPVCSKDFHLAKANLERCLSWNQRVQNDVLIAHDDSINDDQSRELHGLASRYFHAVSRYKYYPWKGDQHWPVPQNYAWQTVARHLEASPVAKWIGWLWWEADAVPIKPEWLATIDLEYTRGNKPFLGHITERQPHLNGVAVYPKQISSFTPDALYVRAEPFDMRLSRTLSLDHPKRCVVANANHIIGHVHKDRGGNAPEQYWKPIAPGIVLLHGAVLPKSPTSEGYRLNGVRKPYQGQSKFFHCGDLGDIIYALKAISIACESSGPGGHLLLGPKISEVHDRCRSPITSTPFKWLLPLLIQQQYLRKVEFHALRCPKDAADMNGFRRLFNERRNAGDKQLSLAKAHTLFLGLDKWDDLPWLTVKCEISNRLRKPQAPRLVFARSHRYRDPDFPWKEIVAKYGKQAAFIGLPTEHEDFCNEFGQVPYLKCPHAEHMAHIISLAEWFIGNQSLPCAIALGLGGKVYQETYRPSPDCVFSRSNFHNRFTSPIDVCA